MRTILSRNHVSGAALISYAALITPVAFVNLPLGIALPSFYVSEAAVSLSAIGAVILAARIFDAFTDPLVGYLSDRTQTKIGPRKPWIIAGTLISVIALLFLFNPGPGSGIVYFAVFSFLFYIGFTCIDIPHKAWGVELARGGKQRARVSSYVTIFTVIGSLVFWIMPIALSAVTGTTAITRDTFLVISVMFACILPLLVLTAVLKAPAGERLSSEAPGAAGLLSSVVANGPARYFYLVYGLWLVGNGVFTATLYVFMSQYMHLEAQFPFLMLAYFSVQILMVPVWLGLVYRFGKKRCWAVSWIAPSLLNISVLFIEPGAGAFVPAMILVVFSGAAATGALLMPMAVLGDVIDYGTLKTGVNRSASYFAFSNILTKTGLALGFGLGFPLLELFGFKWGEPVLGSAKTGLFIVYLGVPGLLSILAGLLVLGFPIDEGRQRIIVRRLEQRGNRRLAGKGV